MHGIMQQVSCLEPPNFCSSAGQQQLCSLLSTPAARPPAWRPASRPLIPEAPGQKPNAELGNRNRDGASGLGRMIALLLSRPGLLSDAVMSPDSSSHLTSSSSSRAASVFPPPATSAWMRRHICPLFSCVCQDAAHPTIRWKNQIKLFTTKRRKGHASAGCDAEFPMGLFSALTADQTRNLPGILSVALPLLLCSSAPH